MLKESFRDMWGAGGSRVVTINRRAARSAASRRLTILALGVFALTVAVGAAQKASVAPISVDNSRPVASVIRELEKRHGWRVTYEDPPYEFAGDLRDVTVLVRKDADPSKSKVYAANAVPFAFKYPDGATPDRVEAAGVLEQLLAAHQAGGNPGTFRLFAQGGAFHVVPATSNNRLGSPERRQSRLDVPITIEPRQRTALEMLRAILSAVSAATKTDIAVGTVPLNVLTRSTVSGGAANEAARSVLMRTLDATGRKLSWRLLCEPLTTMCAFNVHPVQGE